MNKHLLKLMDYTKDEINDFIELGLKLKHEKKNGIDHKTLQGKTIALIFEKSSTRTRVSFEAGVYQLGAHPMFLSSSDIQLARGESIKDTARVLSRYVDGIMIRTFGQDRIEEFAQYSTVPVINGLTNEYHPCQILADIMTVKEYKHKYDGVQIGFIGDGNNISNSYIVAALKLGMKFTMACPKGFEPLAEVLEFAKNYDNFKLVQDPLKAAEGADVIVTDVYVSMGQESDSSLKTKAFSGFQINDKIMSVTNKNCIVQHCLPAHKGEEITEEVFEQHQNEIFDEAENRLHVQKAVMATLF